MENIVYNIDCLEYMVKCKNNKFDLILTDPPYGINLEYNTYKDTEENWYLLIENFIPLAKRISQMVIMPCMRIKKLDWIYKNFIPDWLICWYKGSPGHRSFIGFNDWEPHLVYGKIKGMVMHDYFQTNMFIDNTINHICPKPLDWARKLLKMTSNNKKNKLKVFDPFTGSGTTRIACYELGFDFIGCEIDKDYYEAQEERFAIIKNKIDGKFFYDKKEKNLFNIE